MKKDKEKKIPEYKKAGLAVDYIPTLVQILEEGEEILKGYEKEYGNYRQCHRNYRTTQFL